MSAAPEALGPLDRPLAVTFFSTYAADEKREARRTLRELADEIRTTTRQQKAWLPWLKLSRFGEARTDKNSLRHDANVLAVTGIEADYDGEQMPFAAAVDLLKQQGVAAIVYTSPSHDEGKPRWRVLCPLAEETSPDRREHMLGRLNGLFRGVFAGESFTLSQSYYFGAVNGSTAHRVELVDGLPIDLHDDLDEIWIGRPQTQASSAGGTRSGPVDEAGLLKEIVTGKSYHSAMIRLAGHWANAGISYVDVRKRLQDAMEEVPERARDERWRKRFADIDRTLIYVFGKRLEEEPKQKAKQESPVDPVWVDDNAWTEADLPKRPWVAPGYALRGAVTLLTGPPSAMKSSLMLAWACALALGRDFGRFRPAEPGSVLVYNVEDDQTEQRRRLSAVLRQFDAAPANIANKVIRTGPSGIGTLLTRTDRGVIVDTDAMTRLRTLIAERKPVAFIADPLAELHTAEENDNTALRAVIAAFRQLAADANVAVIVLHHTRKGAAAPGDPDMARGASAIIGAVRIALTLTGMSEDDADAFGLPTDAKFRSAYVRLDDAKQNYAPIGDAQWFEKIPYLLDNDEHVPAAVPWSPPETKAATKDDLALLCAAIERGSPTGEPWSPRLSAHARSVKHLFIKHGFKGKQAQNATLVRLQLECGVETARFQDRHRNERDGLRVNDRPAAQWCDQGLNLGNAATSTQEG